MDRNLDLGVMAELLFTEIIMMSFFMPWLWPVKTASETIFSGDLSFCRLLQMQHSGNVINQLAGLDGGWSYGLYLPLVMAMANIYALVFRKIQGLSLCTGCGVFIWLVVCIQYKWDITHDTMKVSTGFYLALMSSICLVVISLLRFMEKPLEYRKSICYSSAFIVLLSAGLWCIAE